MRWRVLALSLALLASTGTLVLGGTLPAVAATFSCGSLNPPYNYHDGGDRSNNVSFWMYGIKSEIEYQHPARCNSQSFNHFEPRYVMLFDHTGLSGGYAQIGLGRLLINTGDCDCNRFFWEYNIDGTPLNVVRGQWDMNNGDDPVVGTQYPVMAQYRPGSQGWDDKIHLRYKLPGDTSWRLPPDNQGGYQGSSTYFQISLYWGGTAPEVSGEIWLPGDDFMGTSADNTNFFNSKMQTSPNSIGGGYVDTDFLSSKWVWVYQGTRSQYPNLTTCYAQLQKVTNIRVDIYTYPINHAC
jgi:hypothetical protein